MTTTCTNTTSPHQFPSEGSIIHSFDTCHSGPIHDAQMDYYGKRLATASSDCTVKIWDISSECHQLLGEIKGHNSPVWQVSWAHPKFGSLLATVGYDRQILIWREKLTRASHNPHIQQTQQPQQQLSVIWEQIYRDHSHTASVNCCSWSSWEHGLTLACGSSDGSVSIITYESMAIWTRKVILSAHLGGVQAVSWSPATGSATLASGPEVVQQLSNSSCLTPKRIVSAGCDSQIRIWRLDEVTNEWALDVQLPSVHSDVVRDVNWRPNLGIPFQHIASCSEDGLVIIWGCEMEGQPWRPSAKLRTSSAAYRVSWGVTGSILAVASGDECVELFKDNSEGQWVSAFEIDATNSNINVNEASTDPHNVANALLS